MHAIKDMVISGCGITFLYETAVRKEIESNILCKIPIKDFSIHHEISIVWAKDNLFADSFKELFSELFNI